MAKKVETAAGLKARRDQIQQGIVDAEAALADAKRRQATSIAEGGAPDPKLAAEITAGAVALDAARDALELVAGKLAEAEHREELEARERAAAEFASQQSADREALARVRGLVAELASALEPVLATTRQTDLQARRLGLGTVLGRVENVLLCELVERGIIDSRALTVPRSTLRRLAGRAA